MSIGFCPSCSAVLEDNGVLVTRESKIFKGHNKYAMCKHCGYVMIFNEARGLLYSLDKYKDDSDVLLEVKEFLQEVDPNLTVESSDTCTHDCSTCSGCSSKPKEMAPSLSFNEDTLIFVHKQTKECIITNENDFVDEVDNLEDYDVFSLAPVIIEPVISYKIHRL